MLLATEDFMDELHERVIEHIRQLAEARGIALSHLPDRAAVARSHFWDVMAGRKSPTLHWLERIAQALEVDVGDLLLPLLKKED